MKARELGKRSVVVGDRVALVGDVCGGPDSLARVVRVEPRHLDPAADGGRHRPLRAGHRRERRPARDRHRAGRPAAAHPADRPVPGRRVRRRSDAAALPDQVRPRVARTSCSRPTAPSTSARRRPSRPAARRAPATGCATGPACSSATPESASPRSSTRWSPAPAGPPEASTSSPGRGRHTSSSAIALELPGGGWVIDTPGIRSFGLAHVDLVRVIRAFPDLEPGTEECPRGCTHDEPECALDDWVAAGHADPARLDSLRRLLRSRDEEDDEPAARLS